jgi:hypothetical protein
VKFCRSAPALTAWLLVAWLASASSAVAAANSPDALIDEMRRAFTVDGKPVPPEIFRDFGDGDLADSGPIWVTVDVKAAIGSNLYYDAITKNGDWLVQRKVQTPPLGSPFGDELTSYTFIGTADNGLLVVLASYSGGGTGVFYTLHVLDVAAARAFDSEGKVYDRVNLTDVRSMPLGDRWSGEVTIAHNAVTIVTERAGPTDDSGVRRTTVIAASRP